MDEEVEGKGDVKTVCKGWNGPWWRAAVLCGKKRLWIREGARKIGV